ncbi:hypothetical protein SAMN05877809_102425 [Rhodobacter sp. JA431]|uniref:DUF6497 family protein n=1 Tax=Rhodobacter sp. JA431 TaxID=570013 RepID=UPI000BDA18BB|nr:DUF6497 family protein [Rhodobacter sp. JA431]SOB99349.1 hypothetical protein SAMN05877809_102425 [Rhodobacter sp. JA431]
MGRGAGYLVKALHGAAFVALALAAARPVLAQEPIAVPSGVAVQWFETLRDTQGPNGLTIRFRFIAPDVAGPDYDPDQAGADLEALCNGYVIPRLPEMGPQPAEIVLDLADREVPFGEPNEDAVQFFEAYSVQDGACVWEFY